MNPLKLVVTSKNNLKFKYGKNFAKIESLLRKLQAADKKKGLLTKIVFIDDAASAKKVHLRKVSSVTEEECKRAVDDLYKKYTPAYIAILGAQDVIPFQEIENPADDDDTFVPSDLPYACDTPFSRKIENFTGPTRVVGRIPDIPGQQQDTSYVQELINNYIKHEPLNPDHYRNYFSVSALVWKKSTALSLQSMFGENSKLLTSPGEEIGTDNYTPFNKEQLNPKTHFYNCHGAPIDLNYYGQKGRKYPEALQSGNLEMNVAPGTIVAAECCYGAELLDSNQHQLATYSIANNYLGNGAIAFVGSSTIAYGPADSQSLADLITQFFIKNVLKGASAGRAFLEARQRYLAESGPDLDPCELKTVAQFYLLGDPSVQPAQCEDAEVSKLTVGNATSNSRSNLFIRGKALESSIGVTKKQKAKSPIKDKKQLNEIFRSTNFAEDDKKSVYQVKQKNTGALKLQKKIAGKDLKFHTYLQVKDAGTKNFSFRVLVVKENSAQILGWRVYESR